MTAQLAARAPFSVAERALPILSVAASFLYLAMAGAESYPGKVLLKACAVAPLAALVALRIGRTRVGGLLALALAACSLGDVLLALGDSTFVHGLGAFLVGHLLYVAVFAHFLRRPLRIGLPHVVIAAALPAYTVAMALWLTPTLGAMQLPVYAYMAAITAMGVTSLLARDLPVAVPVAALLFVFSDSVLAVGMFTETAIPLRGYLVWGSYALSQILMALAFVRPAATRLSSPATA